MCTTQEPFPYWVLGDSREFLAVQQDLLALERGSLIANGELDGGIDFEM